MVKTIMRVLALICVLAPFFLLHLNYAAEVPDANSFPEGSAVSQHMRYATYRLGDILPMSTGLKLHTVDTTTHKARVGNRWFGVVDIICNFGLCYGVVTMVTDDGQVGIGWYDTPVPLPLRYWR